MALQTLEDGVNLPLSEHEAMFHKFYHIKTSSSGFSLTGLPGIAPTGERGLRWELLKVSVSRRANAIYVNMLLCTDSNSAGCRYPA